MILAALWLVACDDPELQLSNAGEQAAGRIASAGLAAPPGGVVSAGEPSSAGTGTMGGNLGTAGRMAPGGRSGAAGQDNLGGRGGMSGAGGQIAGMAATAAGTPVAGHSGSAGSESTTAGMTAGMSAGMSASHGGDAGGEHAPGGHSSGGRIIGGAGAGGMSVENSVCTPCDDAQACPADLVCASVGHGHYCVHACDGGECDMGFSCEDNVCVPDDRSCLPCDDPDMDGYGLGEDCVAEDCVEFNGAIHADATDGCDAIDNDCDGRLDEDAVAGTCALGGMVAGGQPVGGDALAGGQSMGGRVSAGGHTAGGQAQSGGLFAGVPAGGRSTGGAAAAGGGHTGGRVADTAGQIAGQQTAGQAQTGGHDTSGQPAGGQSAAAGRAVGGHSAPGGDAMAGGAIPPHVCEACMTDDDCEAGLLCSAVGHGRYCVLPCEADSCTPGFQCRDDVCIPDANACLPCDDIDGDGYGFGTECLGLDCDEADRNVHAGAIDVCDGENNDCDDQTDEGHVPALCGEGACASTSTCVGGLVQPCVPGERTGDDLTCDGADNDCDGRVDEGYPVTACGVGVCSGTSTCIDGVETQCEIGPAHGLDNTCDGRDDDCDGKTDEHFEGESCGVGVCTARAQCVDGVVRPCEEGRPLAVEDINCNGNDDDCDGNVDEAYVPSRCGLGVCAAQSACQDGQEAPCEPGLPNDASDTSCNGVDDDCDGAIDDDFVGVACGDGACQRHSRCVGGQELDCEPGQPLSDIDRLCDGVDENCDGDVDEACESDLNVIAFDVTRATLAGTQVDVVYTGLFDAQAIDTPRAEMFDLDILVPAGLTVLPGEAGVTAGPALAAAQKTVEVQRLPNGHLRILIDGLNENRVQDGIMIKLAFGPAAPGQYDLDWTSDRTRIAPKSADEIRVTRGTRIEIAACVPTAQIDETCDGIDADCDGLFDEDYVRQTCGLGVCAAESQCTDGVETACPQIMPRADDAACNGQDDDCDGNVDEAFTPTPCGQGPCQVDSVCEAGVETCTPNAPLAPSDTSCNGVDDDCDGTVDDDYTPEVCGVGACAAQSACIDGEVTPCEPGDAAVDDASCDGIDNDCNGDIDDGFVSSTCGVGPCEATSVCADGNESCTPGQPLSDTDNTCDGIDDDCSGRADEDYRPQRCGVGACARLRQCVDGALEACPAPPPATDQDVTCDGVDDDCDGSVDEDYVSQACGAGQCAGMTQCASGTESCEETIPPAADDITCDNVDDDCDGRVDEGYRPTGCGAGTCRSMSRCEEGVETLCVPQQTDAGDEDAECDGRDTDCDGLFDEGYQSETCGIGACQSRSRCFAGLEFACEEGQAAPSDDTCDLVDDDCDGANDEDYVATHCGIGACAATSSCDETGETVCTPGPAAANDATCDEQDDDCDGTVDEDCPVPVNELALHRTVEGADVHEVEIRLDQRGLGADAVKSARIEVQLGEGYTFPLDNLVAVGPDGVSHDPTIQRRDDRTLVLFFINLAGEDLKPGHLATLYLNVAPGAQTVSYGPGTFLAPQAANELLILRALD